MKTKEIRNIKKDKIRPKQTNFSILLNYKVHTIDLKIPKGKKKHNRTMIIHSWLYTF